MVNTKEFRPIDFSSVYGLDNVKEFFQKVLSTESYDTAYLFTGGLSSGKTTMARLFARSVLCVTRKEDMSPCNECPSCRAFLEGRGWGYTEIDAATNSGKDEVKELMESLQYETVTKKRIILFDEAHNLSEEAKDTLLKKIEDPFPNVIFIFCTTEKDKMPETLASRCVEFTFTQPSEGNVYKKLVSICGSLGLKYEEEALRLITRSVKNFYRFAENRLKTVSRFGDITLENTKKVVLNYDEEIVEMLLSMSYDLPVSLLSAEKLSSKLPVKSIYESVVRLLTDSLKLGMGICFDSEAYEDILKKLQDQYGDVQYELLSYVLAKNKFADVTYLQSDLLVLNYKFVRGQFSPKKPLSETERSQVAQPQKKEGAAVSMFADLHKLPPWKREDAVRELRTKKNDNAKDERVKEAVSDHWPPEVEKSAPQKVVRSLTPQEFRKVLNKGESNGGRV